MPKLLLFDIDGTLVDTGGEGGLALLDAVEEVLNKPREIVPRLELAGATDGGITRQLFHQLDVEWDEEQVAVYIRCYLKHLERRMKAPTFPGRLLPGVTEVLEVLSQNDDMHLGLLTGNVKAGAEIKLRHFDVWTYFADGAFADDAEDRNLLGPFAISRMKQFHGVDYSPDDVFVIGDTPKDIACARAIGARCIAVTTGCYDRASLEQSNAWAVLDALDPDALVRLLTS
jgi:phosphoglycolate phosphatase